MRSSICLTLLLGAPVTLAAQQPARTVDYHKADLIRTAIAYATGTRVGPNWLSDSVRFWYKSDGSKDHGTYYLVDPVRGARSVLFDQNKMAAALSVGADTILDPNRFPHFRLVNKDQTLEIATHKNTFRCELASYKCVAADTLEIQRRDQKEDGPRWATRSPDKK